MNSSERAFTLIEVMVALTILGLIAGILANGTRLSIDISAKTNARAEAGNTERLGRILIRGQLEGALPFYYWTQAEEKRVLRLGFNGGANRITFVSRDGVLDGPGSLPRWIDIHCEAGSGAKPKLIIEERRILSPDNQPGESTTARAESLDCDGLRFEYLNSGGENPQWQPGWADADHGLPDAVRISYQSGGEPMKMLIPLDYAEAARQGMQLQ